MAKQTKTDLFNLMDWPDDIEGEGPFLLVEISPYLGLKLMRFATWEEASVRPMNYSGPGRSWIFEAGKELGVKPFPEWDDFIGNMVDQIADRAGVERPSASPRP